MHYVKTMVINVGMCSLSAFILCTVMSEINEPLWNHHCSWGPIFVAFAVSLVHEFTSLRTSITFVYPVELVANEITSHCAQTSKFFATHEH